MELNEYKNIVLQEYENRLNTINAHIGVWEKKLEELNQEKHRIIAIMEITKTGLDEQAKKSK